MGITSADLAHYTGLVNRTAALVAPDVAVEVDEVAQLLWIGVWQAVARFDKAKAKKASLPSRNGRSALDRYVFMCLTDRVKDLKRKRKRPESYIEDLRLESGDSWDLDNGLSVDDEVVFAEVEDEPVELPSTLTFEEKAIIELLLIGFRQTEAARYLGWPERRIEPIMRSIRLKLADWQPDAAVPAEPLLALAA